MKFLKKTLDKDHINLTKR